MRSTTNPPGQNRLLTSLPDDEYDRVTAVTEKVSLALKEVIYEPGQRIEHVYFPTSGVVSLLITMQDGSAVEIATVGNEGVVGMPVFLGAHTSLVRAISQIPGTALRMPVAAFKHVVEPAGAIQDVIRRYSQALVNQISQSVACNHLHSVEERMCRWLLMCHDRVGADEFPLSHEFLAQMLGVRRPSVTIAAGILQKAGLIAYRRGHVTIVDRGRLEEGACECYRVVKDEYERLLGAPTA
jgi:CRP-like cAMP-binding protein